MIWLVAGIGYFVALAIVVRFFQFVSDRDRSIRGFIVSNDAAAAFNNGTMGWKSSRRKGVSARRRSQKKRI